MTWADAAPAVSNAVSVLITYWITRSQHVGTREKAETESSKIQLGVVQSATDVKAKVIEAVETKPVAASVDYGDRMTAVERKQDLIIFNLKRKPGTPWIDDITQVKEPKETA